MAIKQVNSITILVDHLDDAADYYTKTIGFPVVDRQHIASHPIINMLTGGGLASCDIITLDAVTTYIELMQLSLAEGEIPHTPMAVYDSGITHVCYQSPAENPAYPRIKAGRTQIMTRGAQPVDLAGAGITYAYARDPEGSIFEMEQLDNPPRSEPLWLGHVAWVTHDIERLSTFYNVTLMEQAGTPPNFHFHDNPRIDAVADIDNLDLRGAWIREMSVHLEFWQYLSPPTPPHIYRKPLKTGYLSANFAVNDTRAEFKRLLAAGVDFMSEPFYFNGSITAFGYDPDGNLFQLCEKEDGIQS